MNYRRELRLELDCLLARRQLYGEVTPFGFIAHPSTTMQCAMKGDLRELRFLHEKGCPWDETLTKYTAATGQLACLDYAIRHGCPFDDEAVTYAARFGKIQCLLYLVERGGVVTENALRCANEFFKKHQDDTCLTYLSSKCRLPFGTYSPEYEKVCHSLQKLPSRIYRSSIC